VLCWQSVSLCIGVLMKCVSLWIMLCCRYRKYATLRKVGPTHQNCVWEHVYWIRSILTEIRHFGLIFGTDPVPFCVYFMDRQLPNFMLILPTLYTDWMSCPLDLCVCLCLFIDASNTWHYAISIGTPAVTRCRGRCRQALCAIKLPSAGTFSIWQRLMAARQLEGRKRAVLA